MGYLDNSSITVDAILTKRGRELLARNDGSFRITQFALGDDVKATCKLFTLLVQVDVVKLSVLITISLSEYLTRFAIFYFLF